MKMNKKVTAIGGLAALAVVGGTWAFFTQNSTLENKLFTKGNYGYTNVEKFNPSSEWEPGSVVDKEIGTTNTGDAPLVLRVKMDEEWTNTEGEVIANWNSKQNPSFYNVSDIPSNDGNVKNDISTVVKKIFYTDNMTNDSSMKQKGKWYLANDGYFYYCDALQPKEAAPSFLDGIELDKNADMGVLTTKYYAIAVEKGNSEPSEEDQGWEELQGVAEDGSNLSTKVKEFAENEKNKGKDIYTKVESGTEKDKMGYSNASYTLNITTEALQATPEAVAELWKNDNSDFPTDLFEAILGVSLDNAE